MAGFTAAGTLDPAGRTAVIAGASGAGMADRRNVPGNSTAINP
jgi:hypothetical protein